MLRTIAFQKVLLIIFLILSSASQAGSVSAGVNVWTSIGPEGGYIHGLVIDPTTPTTLYAGTNGGGVFVIQQMDVKSRFYLPFIQHSQQDLSETAHNASNAMTKANIHNEVSGLPNRSCRIANRGNNIYDRFV